LLKACLFALLTLGACAAAASAAPVALLVGSVRDGSGAVVAGASVRAFDAAGGSVGAGTTDRAGTFAVALDGPAVAVGVACRYCAPLRLAVPAGGEPVVAIVRRFRALAGPAVDQGDFAALPYAQPAQAIALATFVVPLAQGGNVVDLSDRGLERGRGLVLDQNAPAYDFVSGGSALVDFPGRSVQSVDLQPATAAYRYGSYAGGGTFALDAVGEARDAAAADAGPSGAFAGYAHIGDAVPAAAISENPAGPVQRRASADYDGSFAGGILRAGVAAADERTFEEVSLPDHYVDVLHLDYATASRRYRTFVDASASQNADDYAQQAGGDVGRSSQMLGALRIEHPGPVTTAFGLSTVRYDGALGYGNPVNTISASVAQNILYAQASGVDGALTYDAGASVARLGVDDAAGTKKHDAGATAFLPSIVLKDALGTDFAVTATASRSLRAPTLEELALVGPALQEQPIERGSLIDAGLLFDDARRLRAAATFYRENLQGYGNKQMTGIGFALTWQVAPLVSLRAWTLHDAALSGPVQYPYVVSEPDSLSRGVVWASYDNGGVVRLDAIVRRDLLGSRPESDLDGDLVVRIVRGLDATVGTSRIAGSRATYVGLRLPVGSH